jgi:hypothetical protein
VIKSVQFSVDEETLPFVMLFPFPVMDKEAVGGFVVVKLETVPALLIQLEMVPVSAAPERVRLFPDPDASVTEVIPAFIPFAVPWLK